MASKATYIIEGIDRYAEKVRICLIQQKYKGGTLSD